MTRIVFTIVGGDSVTLEIARPHDSLEIADLARARIFPDVNPNAIDHRFQDARKIMKLATGGKIV